MFLYAGGVYWDQAERMIGELIRLYISCPEAAETKSRAETEYKVE